MEIILIKQFCSNLAVLWRTLSQKTEVV